MFLFLIYLKIDNILDGYWHKSPGNKYQYKLLNGSNLQLISTSSVKQCVRDKFNNSISVLGDSHMRFWYFYILHELHVPLPTLSGRMHNDFTKASYYFVWDAFCSVHREKYQTYLDSILAKTRANPYRQFLLVIGHGSWDMLHNFSTVSLIRITSLLTACRDI